MCSITQTRDDERVDNGGNGDAQEGDGLRKWMRGIKWTGLGDGWMRDLMIVQGWFWPSQHLGCDWCPQGGPNKKLPRNFRGSSPSRSACML